MGNCGCKASLFLQSCQHTGWIIVNHNTQSRLTAHACTMYIICIKKWHKNRIMNWFILFPTPTWTCFPWAMSMLGQFSVTIITVLAGGGRMQVPAGDWGDKSGSFSSSLGSSGLLAHQGDEYTSRTSRGDQTFRMVPAIGVQERK